MMRSDFSVLPPAQRRQLRRRRWIVAAVMLATFLFLLLFNLRSYFFLKYMGRELERSLDQRLIATASLTAELIERSAISFKDAADAELLRATLTRIRLEQELEAAYLIDAAGRVVLDARRDLEGVTGRDYVAADSLEIRAALEGATRASRLHSVAGNPFKSAYAPVSDVYGKRAVLVLEASAGFLKTIGQFYRALYIGVIISVLLLAALALFLTLAMIQFVRTESRLYQSERLASMGQMAATVAHEIRNPLAIIKSTADVLREKQTQPERTDEFFGYINEEIVRLNRIVSDFLAYAREPRLERQPCDLVPVLRAIAAGFSRQGADVTWECGLARLEMSCDPDQLEQVVLNLLINARQALGETERRAIILRLREQRRRGHRLAVVEVEDHGPGLQGRGREIFEPFFTTKASGTGLGLAVCKRIIEAHGGEIEALDAPGGGTLMRITLGI